MDTSPTDRRAAAPRTPPRDLDRPLQFEKGVGPARAEKLMKLGVRTARDLLLHVPRRYEDRTRLTNVSGLVPGEEATIRGRVIKIRTGRPRHGPAILTATIEDATAPVDVVWFNQRYLADVLREGTELVVTGKPKLYRNRLQLTPSEYEIIYAPRGGPLLDALEGGASDGGEADDLSYDDEARAAPGSPADLAAGRIVPYYPLTDGISQRLMRSLAWGAVTTAADAFPEIIPASVRDSRGLMTIGDALREAHFPSSDRAREAARRRLVYEELFVLQTGLALVRARAKTEIARVFDITEDVDRRIRARLPFDLTSAQDRAVAEIARDLASGEPMNRLLQGDVGSGKTAVAVYAMLGVIAKGAQAAVMAPTELLAAQHERTLSRYLKGSKVRVAFLKGGQDTAERREELDAISSGRAHIAVGTHALIQEGVEFRSLGLAVVDEQHKFGVEQRGIMKTKGENPHILVMTATPIPRTLALAYFGDLDLSVIDELPPGRGGCDTHVVRQSKRLDAYRKVKAAVKSGRQAYVVCPRVKGKAMLYDFDMEFGPVELRSAVETRERLARGPLKGLRLGLLHGRMSAEEKAEEMERFLKCETQVLVATVVIEVGIDVQNATVLVVEHADRFGLAQLHQLRGRIVRGAHRGECFLVADPKTEGAMERLEALEETTDGFRISEADFRIRGPGEFFGTRQSGLPELRFADILSDTETLKEAREDAFRIVGDREALASDEWAALRRRVAEVFAGRLDLGGVG
ncbi:MAG: ATP-dependent DNA helicase RecG [Planctomycetota bacterium]|jgi:ATP-dependent DNA helicase RecG